jgi:23S rRNA pseudouridine2605 synthase
MYLSHYVAQSGLCSRRKATELIKQGLITVNHQPVTSPAYEVQKDDIVRYRSKPLKLEEKVYILLNKPEGYISSTADEEGRSTILELVPFSKTRRLYPIGRLDKETSGLIILTNDGDLALKLAHPRYQVQKTYEATLDKPLSAEDFEKIKHGIRLKDGLVNVDALYFNKTHNKKIVSVGLHSGKKHIVRRLFEHLDYKVRKLKRTRIADIRTKGLRPGSWRFLTKEEIKSLKTSINK